MNYTYLTAMAKGTAANAIWLQYTAPVWVLLVGVFVFGEKAVWRDWLLVVLAAAGVSVILYYESQGESLGAVLWGLASGVTYAGVVLSLRQLREMDSAWLAALNHTRYRRHACPVCVRQHALSQWQPMVFARGTGNRADGTAVRAIRVWD